MSCRGNTRSCLAGRRVLVAEDDPLIAAELKETLSALGVEVVGPVPTVRAAMAAVQEAAPDMALLDVNLRNASSAPVVAALRSAAVPCVLLTGYSRHLLDDCLLRQAAILSKPVRWSELISMLEQAVAPRCRPRPI